ncbi:MULTISPECIES: hypothetical protein [Vibrio]|uniref:Hydrogenase n=1 Tax=Vibrio lentus TaxID=136468 RepID=A0A855IU78_9VIBR|nr:MULTISPECIES: hypothetical protein [Vibrio]MCB5359007.1 hypothetical protein [Vibrio lentus]MCB5449465.1 hypothetical protein [Vibrio lentus]MCB5461358.1 hypothetical protein [Vibrio lentus]MCC4794707.1 hypothetical protein [Vibrio lentus]MCC4853728.1 hypothetical protein [Vibrio lentus]
MVESLLVQFAPMLLGAQLILTLILVKGDICPGQRGRIHKMLPAIGVLWLAVASLRIEAFLIVFAIFYFYSQVQTKKTRDSGPIWVMYLACGLALSYVAIQASEQVNPVGIIATVLLVALLGASFGHLLLTIARTRLQAFHRVLPVVGVLSGMLVVLATVINVYSLSEAQLEPVISTLLFSFALLISSIVVWCWHLLFAKTPEKVQLTIALLMLLASVIGLTPVWAL